MKPWFFQPNSFVFFVIIAKIYHWICKNFFAEPLDIFQFFCVFIEFFKFVCFFANLTELCNSTTVAAFSRFIDIEVT